MPLTNYTYFPERKNDKLAQALLRNVKAQFKNILGANMQDFIDNGHILKLKIDAEVPKNREEVLSFRLGKHIPGEYYYLGHRCSKFNATICGQKVEVYSLAVVKEKDEDETVTNVKIVPDFYGKGIDLALEYLYTNIISSGVKSELVCAKKIIRPEVYNYLQSLLRNLMSGEFFNNQFQDYNPFRSVFMSSVPFEQWFKEAKGTYLGTIKLGDVLFMRDNDSSCELSEMKRINPQLVERVSGLDDELVLSDLVKMMEVVSPEFAAYLWSEDEKLLNKTDDSIDIIPFNMDGSTYGVNKHTGEVYYYLNGKYNSFTSKESIYELLFMKYDQPLSVTISSICKVYFPQSECVKCEDIETDNSITRKVKIARDRFSK